MIVGSRIEELMLDRGISQAELARRVGIAQPSIYKLLRGESRSSRSLLQIARELQTTPEYLTGETDDPTSDVPTEDFTAEERRWVDLLRSLELADRKAALQLLQTIATSARSPSVHGKGQ